MLQMLRKCYFILIYIELIVLFAKQRSNKILTTSLF